MKIAANWDSPLDGSLKAMWATAPVIYELLKTSVDIEGARQGLYTYLNTKELELFGDEDKVDPLEHAISLEGIKVLKSIMAPRNEKEAGFSTLECLFQIAKDAENARQQVSEGFIQEFLHLFKCIHGQSGISGGWMEPLLAEEDIERTDCRQLEGRDISIARSDYLDQEGQKMWEKINRFPCGLDPDIIAKRNRNKQQVLDFFDATPDHWKDYRWHLHHIFKGTDALSKLERLIPMTENEKEAIRLCGSHHIPFGITPYYLSLFDFESSERNIDGQIRSQVIPPLHYVERMLQHRDDREYYFDFMGEHDTSPIELVTRRYPAVAILKGYNTCPQICIYCQRNWEITRPMEPKALPSTADLDAALDWFAQRPSLCDVLITGGDPLFIGNKRIKYIMDRIAAMKHIVNIRWATRSLVTLPMRISERLAELLGRYIVPGRRNVCLVTHIESAAEITPEMAAAVNILRRQGLYIYNQQVFTFETSRRFQTAANRVAMKRIGVDPYYTFYPKGKEETKDYSIPLARLLQERKEEARMLPGVFRTDEPVFNVPRLGKNHVRAWQDHEIIAVQPDGCRVYLWHPWERAIASENPCCYADNSIYDYLKNLERMGEDPAEYDSIWYYY